jgi:hypothetical protein
MDATPAMDLGTAAHSISSRGPAGPGAATEAVRATLGAAGSVAACVALSARITDLVGGAFERVSREEPVACRAGCSFCCHLRVMVYPHEAIALADELGLRMPAQDAAAVRRRLEEQATHLAGLDPAEPVPPTACAFLVDGRCSVYALRPATCAGYHSLRRERCELRYQTRGGAVGIPISRALQDAAVTVHEELGHALAAAGFQAARVELSTAVLTLLGAPELIRQWLAGGAWQSDARGLLRSGSPPVIGDPS